MSSHVLRWKNTVDRYGSVSMLFHWATAVAFITTYLIVYYVIWIVDPETSIKPPPFGLEPASFIFLPIMCSMGSSGHRIVRTTARIRSIDMDFQNGKANRQFWGPLPGHSSSGPHGSLDRSVRIL